MIYSIQKNPAPNIVTGMHFNKERFNELYNWINAAQMDSIAALMKPNRFGLLYIDNSEHNFRLEIQVNEVQLYKCFAVTENGSLIVLTEETKPALSKNILDLPTDGIYDIMIAVDCNNRMAMGKEDETETPKRQPYSIPKYNLDISIQGEKDPSKFPSAIKVGELIKEGQISRLNVKYIPPCAHVGAHPLMLEKFNFYRDQIEQLFQSFLHVSKVTRMKIDVDTTNLHRLVNFGGQYIASSKGIFEAGNKTVPIEVFEFCKSLANVLHFHYHSLNRQIELAHLIEKNVAHAVGIQFPLNAFRADVGTMATAKYNSFNLTDTLQVIDQFLSTIVTNGFEVLAKNNAIVSVTKDTISDSSQSPPKQERKKNVKKKNGPWF